MLFCRLGIADFNVLKKFFQLQILCQSVKQIWVQIWPDTCDFVRKVSEYDQVQIFCKGYQQTALAEKEYSLLHDNAFCRF